MQLATDVLTKNPSSGTYEGVWESISTIYTTLNAVAVSLLCVFLLYGFCRDSCDLRTDLTFDRTIKMFNRLIITSNVMSMALTYIGLCGFYQKNGMTLVQLVKSTIRLIFQKPYVYETRNTVLELEAEYDGKEKSKQRRKKQGKYFV